MIKKKAKKVLNAFYELFFPRICNACQSVLGENEKIICNECKLNLPFVELHSIDEKVKKKVKIEIDSAFSLLYFQKDNLAQGLIHNLKYKGILEIGNILGNLLAEKIKSSTPSFDADVILPIPLHKKRLKKRGYNQSLTFAKALSQSLGISLREDILSREIHRKSQTFKSKEKRLEEIQDAFSCSEKIKNFSHIMLIDDVLTTGATLESCARCILKEKNLKISIATIAYAI